MKEVLKNVVYAGLGAAFLTKEKIEELSGDFVEKGKMTKDEGKQFIDELIGKSEQAKEQLEQWLTQRVDEKIKKLNLATREEVEELRAQIQTLKGDAAPDNSTDE